MYDAEFFLDPICPWCWITSRWVVNVQAERDYSVNWRFIALKVVNEDRVDGYSSSHRAGHEAGFRSLRVADAVRQAEGNDAVGRYYTALGTAIHNEGRRDELVEAPVPFLTEVLRRAGLDEALADHADDASHDDTLRAETATALERTGPDVGTPIITFAPGMPAERSFFGPVLPRAPKGEEATKVWDAIVTLAQSDVAEVKRSIRGERVYE